ncbi:hypothetical protein [Burkholderia gladioli]|uniref:hypothetical protein n=1 Tax=Burkholderia gladioli TaxID=28095 RepID=UPI00163F8430|nr:hypothetical protein [Burkholderia gladioli]
MSNLAMFILMFAPEYELDKPVILHWRAGERYLVQPTTGLILHRAPADNQEAA